MADVAHPAVPVEFQTHPSRYRHWKLSIDGAVARLAMAVDNQAPQRPGYDLKLNSYDLAVDIELADAVERLRFEHPNVKVVVVSSDRDRVFCAGANIFMLGASSHPFKVNFCKYTNETRLSIEDASEHSHQRYIAAVNGACAGGGYELALACDEILLVDDGSSAVSLPEVPLLGVLPGTGGLTRLVDKRRVRRDIADLFSTLAEGVKGKRAVEWGIVDATAPRSKFAELVAARVKAIVDKSTSDPATASPSAGVPLPPLEVIVEGDSRRWRHVELKVDRARHTAELVVHAPSAPPPTTLEGIRAEGAAWWPLQMSRELDAAILELRFFYEEVGVVLVRARGDVAHLRAVDGTIIHFGADWFVREVRLHLARTLRRLDVTGRSFFAVVDSSSSFVGSLLEIALACDRVYMLDAEGVTIGVDGMNVHSLPMPNGLPRLESRFLGDPQRVQTVLATSGPIDAETARELGLVTVAADDIDFEDELRVAVEERVSLSPDALTGMEASLRFGGPETLATKIFGRLSAWQNWIFTRPNATGPTGALTLYGRPERPTFDFRRT